MIKSGFKPPEEGINFSCRNFISITALSKDLCKIAAFIQDKNPYSTLQRFEDWWEHDGLHFVKDTTNLHNLFVIVESPRTIYEAMPGEDYVRIGIAPSDGKWYLRFYADWDEQGELLEGNYDITLPIELAEEFRMVVVHELEATIEEEISETYFKRIIP